ncbi:HPP family protein [Paracoccus seriniphilus]|uniref:CBS domain-containing membrane protein n=1 Tax=Paracoccus seriniphilus TaxID=184748 RepID=A0A239PWD6_9RHOB|nr:HPP family protein [Paracoccus seriniphilus]WCR13358.1 HPP family protein [Paracoccus seriniphilus]SNT74398.1 CBS domain-containing membrane protein [Paracoccus seriniphilus]
MTTTLTRRTLRALGPAIPIGSVKESLRAGGGALLGLAVAALVVLLPAVNLDLGLYLIAPFGATSVLIFAVPSSPLAQPWSAVIGNSASAVVAVAICLTIDDPNLRITLAVSLAIVAMILLRALHPPGGAVAMTAAMNAETMHEMGFWFALSPVALGTALLVAVGIVYARATGRHYPLRQFEDPNSHGTDDPEPAERLGLSAEELTDILASYRQSLNLGVEDLARLIAAAEMQAASHRTGPLTAADIMSRDLVTVPPDATLGSAADLFRQHGFTSLPVTGPGDVYLGVIFQLHLIRRARRDAFASGKRFGSAMAVLLENDAELGLRAEHIMETDAPVIGPDDPVAGLLPKMADGRFDAVPVLDGERIVGIVTRTDLIAALARQSLNIASKEEA